MSLGLNSLPGSCVCHVWFIRELLAIEIRETLPLGQKIGKFEPQKVKNINSLTKKRAKQLLMGGQIGSHKWASL